MGRRHICGEYGPTLSPPILTHYFSRDVFLDLATTLRELMTDPLGR